MTLDWSTVGASSNVTGVLIKGDIWMQVENTV